MGLFTSGRRDRMAAAALLLVLLGSLVPFGSALGVPRHHSVEVGPASGGAVISADESGTSNYTPLVGPTIGEANTGELALNSTTILNIPAGFRFHPGVGTVSIDGIECDLRGDLSVTASQATFTVTHSSTVSGCVVWFVGLEVQPTSGQGLTNGIITKTGTSAAPGGTTNYGTLTEVPGALVELVFQVLPSPNNFGGTAFGTQPEVVAWDEFANHVARVPVTLSIKPGTGAPGAHLTCASNPVMTDASGVADFSDCRIDRAGNYTLKAVSGHVAGNGGTLKVNVGPAVKLEFTAYPAATTKSTLSPQPIVAVTDAGGNTVTSYPPTHIVLAINKNAGTFTCPGGFTIAQTVHGVAQFHGCKQTAVGHGYRLTAWTGFSATIGSVFQVTR